MRTLKNVNHYHSNAPSRPPWPGRLFVLSLAAAGLMLGCGGDSTAGGNNNTVVHCEGDTYCPAGMVCEGNVCIDAPDVLDIDSEVLYPDLVVSPDILDFESPLLGVEVTLPLTLHNVGDADLEITQILIDEPGSLKEFHADQEGALSPALIIPPGGQEEIQVSLLALDDELDTGTLRIFSNDPEDNPTLVQLKSSHKGVQDVEVCAFTKDATPPYDNPPYSDCVVNASDDPVIDFQVVRFDEPASRVLAIWNSAEGNAPLAIESIHITNNTGNAAHFGIHYFMQDPDTGDATNVTLPAYLSAGDPLNAIPPSVLYVQVDFDALADVFPEEQLEIRTNDSDQSQIFVDIIGVVSGCPENYWDINGDPDDGCEYYCEFQQTTETCATVGVDDNCNGAADEEDADGCMIYFRDHDGDGFGAIGDSRCLCAPEGEYTADVGGDCNDDNANVKPGATERCITDYDDNCDGSDNDPGAQGCVHYLRDEDGDGYGVTGDSRCLCYAEGVYSTTLGGDCDDDPSACGAACNPGATESCVSPYDENCNGDNNERDAAGCITYYRDYDGDGYGHETLSQCWCYPRNDYTAVDPTDCNDSNDQIHPSATEVCDGVDNNCDGRTDEGFDLQTDVSHCGSCNHACTNAHGTTACVSGVCSPTCSPGWGDCDGNPDNGCEQDLSVATYCGGCASHMDCPSGFFCNSSATCQKKNDLGAICNDPVQCASGYCKDGVCCNNSCTGLCRSCDLSGHEGTCTYHTAGTDQDAECAREASSTCGQNGECDGSGSCQFYGTSTVCDQETCDGETHRFADYCDGSGTCLDSGSESCSPYICDTNDKCRTGCTGDNHCVAGYYCSGGQCLPESGLGDICTTGAECSTGHCYDGVCCNQECSGNCKACNLPGSEGTCINHDSNTDPEGGCGLCRVCDGNGSCTSANAGEDPKNQCADERSTNPCGQDGTCNGGGACRLVPYGVVCAGESCTNHVYTSPAICDGSGTCVPGDTQNCSPYECSGSACGSSCGSDAGCVSGYYCNSSSLCAQKKDYGSTCGGNSECVSNYCVDGVCCNNACDGICEGCAISGSVGTCSYYAADTDPERECDTSLCRSCNGSGGCKNTSYGVDNENECLESSAQSCGTRDWCDGSGSCDYWDAGTVCVSQSCSNHVEQPERQCDGNGTCVNDPAFDCFPYQCSGSSCASSCGNDTDCVSPNICISGVCCAPVGADSGGTCGTGTLFTKTNSGTPTPIIINGNLDENQVRWYRLVATEYANDLNVWIWLEQNPGDEFRIDVSISDDSITNCSSFVQAGCDGADTHYSWWHSGSGPWTSNDSKTFYVKVYRNSAVTPTCNQYELRMVVGGSQPW